MPVLRRDVPRKHAEARGAGMTESISEIYYEDAIAFLLPRHYSGMGEYYEIHKMEVIED